MPRRLGLTSATALVIGEVIGVGIFLTPAGMAKSLGSPFWLLVAWVTMGLIAICGALTYGALAARYPEDGGGYVYLRRAFGPRLAFLYGWMSLLVTDPGLTAMMAAGLAGYAGTLIGLSPIALKLVAIVAIVAMAGANILGLGIGAWIVRALTAMKLGLLAAIAIWGLGFGEGSWSHFRPFVARPSGSEPLSEAMVGGLIAAFISLAGWWDASKIAGEVRNPARNLPRSLLLGVSIVTIVYILISGVLWYLIPLAAVEPDRGLSQAGEALFGVAGGRIFSAFAVLLILGNLAGILMAAPRVYYAMARDGLFPAGLAAIHPRFGTPARATAVQAVVASALVASGSFDQILSYFMAVTLAFLVLTVVVIYILPREPGAARVPGYPIIPLGFIAPVALIAVMRLAGDPIRSGIGAGIVALGLPVYEIFLRGSATRVHAGDPGPHSGLGLVPDAENSPPTCGRS